MKAHFVRSPEYQDDEADASELTPDTDELDDEDLEDEDDDESGDDDVDDE